MTDVKIKKEYRITCNLGLYDTPHGGGWHCINKEFVVYDKDLDKACRKMSKELAQAHCFRSGCEIDQIERIYYKNCVFDVDTDMITIESQEIFDTKIFRTPYYYEILNKTIDDEKKQDKKSNVAEFLRLKALLFPPSIL